MKRSAKRLFINELMKNVHKDIMQKLPLLPEDWDGHELRRYIADKFEDCAFTVGPRVRDKGYRRRYRDYKNAVVTGNL